MERYRLKFSLLISGGALILVLGGCRSTGVNLDSMEPGRLVMLEDSLMIAHPDDPGIKSRLVAAHLSLARESFSVEEYKNVLRLDPGNAEARYQIAMSKGKQLYQQGNRSALWDALVAFGKAAAAIDSLGEPHYWMAKSYLKKDDMDFDLVLEAYNKAIARSLPDTLRPKIEAERETLLQRKNAFQKFWK